MSEKSIDQLSEKMARAAEQPLKNKPIEATPYHPKQFSVLKRLFSKNEKSPHLAFDYSIENYEKKFGTELLKTVNHQQIIRTQAIPVRLEQDELTILTTEVDNEATLEYFKSYFGVSKIYQLSISGKDLFDFLNHYYQDKILQHTLYDLMDFQPNFSASYVFTKKQVGVMALMIATFLTWLYFDVMSLYIFIFLAMQCIYLASISFRLLLSIAGVQNEFRENITNEEMQSLKDADLPIYTVLVPVYKEPSVVPHLLKALRALDYPHEKLDVLLLMEENDTETIKAAKEASPPANWRFVIIPNSLPKTKPKACSYGLQFARGEYLTIYDAEDLPGADQLKKALIAHQRLGSQCFCVQAALNYFNVTENYITTLFTLEYSYWFDYLLPGLDYFGFPIPLGGTSNHFRTQHLRDMGGWDPYNTTEDADLGLRAYTLGYKIGVINSTTLEEANSRWWNFIRQRSRWLKGYMQTSLVYNRHPIRLMRHIGFKNWVAFQLLITGTPLMLIINPLVWLVFIAWTLGWMDPYFSSLPPLLVYFGLFNLIISNFIGIYLNMLGVFKRKQFKLIPLSLLNPFYWLGFHSVAAYKALWQLFANPFYWEKTDHGISQIKPPNL